MDTEESQEDTEEYEGCISALQALDSENNQVSNEVLHTSYILEEGIEYFEEWFAQKHREELHELVQEH